MTDAISVIVTLVVLVATIHVTVTAHGEVGPYIEESVEWCDERGGELYNEKSVAHGGLHCELPNGTTVHMKDVIDVNESEAA